MFNIYENNYDTSKLTKNCSTLDSSTKLELGNTYCGPFVNFIDTANNSEDIQKKKNGLESIKEYCRQVLKHDDIDFDNFSCINMCLNINKYVDKIKYTSDRCGFSSRLLLFIGNIVKWLKYIMPVFIMILSILDFIKAIANDKEDEMKKAQKRFIIRLVVVVLIFIIPFIIEFILNVFGFDKYIDGCGIFDI